MRISDWSSDVCSSDLRGVADGATLASLFEDPVQQSALAAPVGDMRWNNVDALLHTLGNDRFWASTSISRVQLGGLDRLLVVASDVSEQRQLTELLGYQATHRSEEHTSELQSLMRISYAVFCLKKKKTT